MRLMPTEALRLHPDADLVPEMSSEQFTDFQSDIGERGVVVPIEVVEQTTIVDGRSRWQAAKAQGVGQVPVVDAPLHGLNPVVYMLRAASKRRHLTDDQRACLAQEEMEYLATLHRVERARAGGIAGGRGRPKVSGDDSLPTASVGKQTRDRSREARTQVTYAYGVSHRKVRTADQLRREAPQLYSQVRAGQLRLFEAKRAAEREAKRAEQRAHAERFATVESTDGRWQLLEGDCLVEMAKLPAGSVRLVFADPPYNIGVDYGDGADADRKRDHDFLEWSRAWIAGCVRLLCEDGSLWVVIDDEYADHFGLLLRNAGLHRRAWIKWYETFGVNCSNNFNRCSRHIFYCVKHPHRFVFHADAVSRPSDRQSKYGDKRAAPGGKLWDNVWCIPRLVENSKERLPDFPTQLPLELLAPIVACASDSGDTVFDPFAGSGTTGVAALQMARRFVGCERNPRFAAAGKTRLASAASWRESQRFVHQ